MAELNEDDLRQRSQALNEVQELWEELIHLGTPKVPCTECMGAGAVYGGSLGNICPKCMGSRLIAAPGRHELPPMPPFSSMRRRITEYGNALVARQLPAGHPALEQLIADGVSLDLPDPSTIPTLEEIENLRTAGEEIAGKLQPASRPALHELPEFRNPEDPLTDKELDQLEREAEENAQDADFEEHDHG